MGYYDATRTATRRRRRGFPQPGEVGAVRPTLVLALRVGVPPSAWRWLARLSCLASLLLAWRLARAIEPLARLMSLSSPSVA